MTFRVLCDTNVLVSALIADGPPSRVLDAGFDGRIVLVVPSLVLEELERTMSRKFRWPDEQVRAVHRMFEPFRPAGPPLPAYVSAITGDHDDDRILAWAVEAGVDILVTGDRKHLLPLREHRTVRLLTPQVLLAELRAGGHEESG